MKPFDLDITRAEALRLASQASVLAKDVTSKLIKIQEMLTALVEDEPNAEVESLLRSFRWAQHVAHESLKTTRDAHRNLYSFDESLDECRCDEVGCSECDDRRAQLEDAELVRMSIEAGDEIKERALRKEFGE